MPEGPSHAGPISSIGAIVAARDPSRGTLMTGEPAPPEDECPASFDSRRAFAEEVAPAVGQARTLGMIGR